jgi:hypothetical protein
LRAALHALRFGSAFAHTYCSLAPSRAFYERSGKKAVFGPLISGCCLLKTGKWTANASIGPLLWPSSGPAHRFFRWMLYLAHRPASAEQWPQAALVPDRGPLQTLSACPCLSEPRSLRRRSRAGGAAPYRPPNPLSLSVLGAWLAHLDQREEAPNVVATRRERQTEAGYIESHAIAQVHITLGNIDRAIGSAARSLDERQPFSASLKHDPEFDPLGGVRQFGDCPPARRFDYPSGASSTTEASLVSTIADGNASASELLRIKHYRLWLVPGYSAKTI